MQMLSQLMQSKSKTLFEIGKKAAASEAAIATGLGAIKAYQSLAGIPIVGPALGIAAAAALTAFGMERVRGILSTPFGGGVTAAGSVGVSASTGYPTGSIGGGDFPAPQQPGGAREVKVAIEFHGSPPPDGWVRDSFLPVLERALRDGAGSGGVSFA